MCLILILDECCPITFKVIEINDFPHVTPIKCEKLSTTLIDWKYGNQTSLNFSLQLSLTELSAVSSSRAFNSSHPRLSVAPQFVSSASCLWKNRTTSRRASSENKTSTTWLNICWRITEKTKGHKQAQSNNTAQRTFCSCSSSPTAATDHSYLNPHFSVLKFDKRLVIKHSALC